jgi:hypothetical protein
LLPPLLLVQLESGYVATEPKPIVAAALVNPTAVAVAAGGGIWAEFPLVVSSS